MESSRVISRCVHHALRDQPARRSCLHLNQSTPVPRQRNFHGARAIHRTFSTTKNTQADEGKNESSASGQTDSKPAMPGAMRRSLGPNSQSRTQQDRPRRSPREAGRIDLSTIPGMPPNYKPPNRPDEATAQAKLRSLLGAVTPAQDKQPSSRPGESSLPRSNLDAYMGTQGRRRQSPAFDLASLIEDLDRPRRSGSNSGDTLKNLEDEAPEVLRLRPTLGRTVNVTPATGFDLTRAFRTLEMKCNANSVKRDAIKQRFHVRQGQRKKLERRMRWRVLFKEGFLAECARIRRMRAQGW